MAITSKPTADDLKEIREAFVAEFGDHKAANSLTGKLLGVKQDKPGERPAWSVAPTA